MALLSPTRVLVGAVALLTGALAPATAAQAVSQEEALRFLRDPASYPAGAGSPEIHSTHGSWVFLAGDLAYKLKKEIDLGWMDYSTPEKRRRFANWCRRVMMPCRCMCKHQEPG